MLGKEVCQAYVRVHWLLESNGVKCEALHEHGQVPQWFTLINEPCRLQGNCHPYRLHAIQTFFSAYSATVPMFSPLAPSVNLFKRQLDSAWGKLFAEVPWFPFLLFPSSLITESPFTLSPLVLSPPRNSLSLIIALNCSASHYLTPYVIIESLCGPLYHITLWLLLT